MPEMRRSLLFPIVLSAVLLALAGMWAGSALMPAIPAGFERPSERDRLLEVQRILGGQVERMERDLAGIEAGRLQPDSDAHADDLRRRIAEGAATLARLRRLTSGPAGSAATPMKP